MRCCNLDEWTYEGGRKDFRVVTDGGSVITKAVICSAEWMHSVNMGGTAGSFLSRHIGAFCFFGGFYVYYGIPMARSCRLELNLNFIIFGGYYDI